MSHEIEIEGCLIVPDKISLDNIINEILELEECRGWYFRGRIQEFKDDHYETIDVGEED